MLRTEQEIMKNWKGDISKPVVSICCITYNHEKYIEDAIKGFLIQETDFPFEIIIRDDASTDNTPNIIKKYQKQYPNIIKPIFESENTYSKDIKPFPIVFQKAKGKYIALCEGDDYWIESKKLQIQYNKLNKYQECSLCGHDVYIVSENKKIIRKHSFGRANKNWNSGVYQAYKFIGSSLTIPHTSSIFIRKKSLDFKLFEEVSAYDYHIIVSALINGNGYYINDCMSCYRQNPYSLSGNINHLNNNLINLIKDLHFKLIKYLNGKYKKEILNNLNGHYIMKYNFLMNYNINKKLYIKSFFYLFKLFFLCNKNSFYNKKDVLWIFKNELKNTLKEGKK